MFRILMWLTISGILFCQAIGLGLVAYNFVAYNVVQRHFILPLLPFVIGALAGGFWAYGYFGIPIVLTIVALAVYARTVPSANLSQRLRSVAFLKRTALWAVLSGVLCGVGIQLVFSGLSIRVAP